MKMKITVILFMCFLSAAKSARILGVFPMPSRSHYSLGNALLRGLAEKGHDVTMISPFEETNPPKTGSYRDIVLTGFLEELEEKRKLSNTFEREDLNPFLNLGIYSIVLSLMSENVLNHTKVQQLIKSDAKFDVVITEQFVKDAQKALAHHFDAPLIVFSSIGANSFVNNLVCNPSPPSYIPDLLLPASSDMTFLERLMNVLLKIVNTILEFAYIHPSQTRIIRQHLPNPPNLQDVLKNVSLVLLNSHPSVSQPVPLVPNMIDIGGFHVKPPKKLPKDLQDYLDSAKNGAIYFSMGSNLKSSDFPEEKRAAFLETFAKLKQKVLWKWESDTLPGKPANVKLSKWLPQQDILAHPNVKLFITHGGLLGTIETIYHGKPVLAIPILGDQKSNSRRAVEDGYGLSIPYQSVTEELLTANINELLTHSKYTKTAQLKSKISHDRLVSPMETAVYWVEYIIRHKGAPHLRVAGINLPWYQYYLTDVLVTLIICGYVLVYIIFHIVKKLCQIVFGPKTDDKIKTN